MLGLERFTHRQDWRETAVGRREAGNTLGERETFEVSGKIGDQRLLWHGLGLSRDPFATIGGLAEASPELVLDRAVRNVPAIAGCVTR